MVNPSFYPTTSIQLTAFKELHFANEAAGIKIRFNVNDQGEAPTFTLFQGGEREAKRVE